MPKLQGCRRRYRRTSSASTISYQQIQQIKKMGNMKDLLGMIPGVGKAVRDIDISNDSFKQIEAIIQSMTMQERENPAILSGSRRNRIAKGSGTTIQDVNRPIKQFDEMRKMMKVFPTRTRCPVDAQHAEDAAINRIIHEPFLKSDA